MGKNTSFAVAATVLGLVMVLWGKSAVDASSTDLARPKTAASVYFVASTVYLPFRVADPVW